MVARFLVTDQVLYMVLYVRMDCLNSSSVGHAIGPSLLPS